MAEGGPDDSDLEKTVNCPVCFECMFDSRTLYPCIHTFCANCVDRLPVKREEGILGVECPLCRGFVQNQEIRKNRIMDVLINLVSKEDKEVPDEGISCLQCDSTAVNSKCLSCNIDLCQKCGERHRKIPGFKEHRVVLISEIPSRQVKDVIVYCSKHPSEQIKMNCQPCNIAICSQCKFEDHDCHKSESLQSALNRFRPLIKTSLANINKNSSEKRRRIKKIVADQNTLKKNQTDTQSQLTEWRDQMKTKIDEEYETLCDELKTNIGSQIKDLDLQKEALEHSVTCDESVKSWTEAIIANTDGGGLLLELQSGLLNKIQQLQNQQMKSENVCKLYKYNPLNYLDKSILGNITVDTYSVSEVKLARLAIPPKPRKYTFKSPTQLTNNSRPDNFVRKCQNDEACKSKQVTRQEEERFIITPMLNRTTSFRLTAINLSDLSNCRLQRNNTINLSKECNRLCLFQNEIWVPCGRGKLKVFGLDGNNTQTIQLYNIGYVRSLHPLNIDTLLVASDTGLHIMNSRGHIKSHLYNEGCDDVCVNNTTIAAVCYNIGFKSTVNGEVLIWNTDDMSQIKYRFLTTFFTLSYGSNFSLLLQGTNIFVTHTDSKTVHKYNLQGKLIKEFVIPYSRTIAPYICTVDQQCNIMVANSNNGTLLVKEALRGWIIVELKLVNLRDGIISDSMMYILHTNGRQISSYRIKE